MPKANYSHKYDPDKLRRLIEQGKTAQEIMQEISVSPYSLKEHLEMLRRKDKKKYEIPGLYEEPEAAARFVKKRRGKICAFNSNYLPNFRPADAFEMIEHENRIILKKINKAR